MNEEYEESDIIEILNCHNCNEFIDICDNCNNPFCKNDKIFCANCGDSHICESCHKCARISK